MKKQSLNCKIYASKFSKVYVQIIKDIWPNCKIYLLKLQNVFAQIENAFLEIVNCIFQSCIYWEYQNSLVSVEFSSIMGVALSNSINDTGFKVDISSVFRFDTSIKHDSWERIQFKKKELCEKKHLICETFPFVLIHILLFFGVYFQHRRQIRQGTEGWLSTSKLLFLHFYQLVLPKFTSNYC